MSNKTQWSVPETEVFVQSGGGIAGGQILPQAFTSRGVCFPDTVSIYSDTVC